MGGCCLPDLESGKEELRRERSDAIIRQRSRHGVCQPAYPDSAVFSVLCGHAFSTVVGAVQHTGASGFALAFGGGDPWERTQAYPFCPPRPCQSLAFCDAPTRADRTSAALMSSSGSCRGIPRTLGQYSWSGTRRINRTQPAEELNGYAFLMDMDRAA